MGRKKLQHEYKPRWLDEGDGAPFETRWTISNARDTMGYNICTLYAGHEDVPVARCGGGGYDMIGTVWGSWLRYAFQEELKRLAPFAHSWDFWDEEHGDWHGNLPLMWTEDFRVLTRAGYKSPLYGLRAVFDMDFNVLRMSTDGACGDTSMFRIFNALGWSVKNMGRGSGRDKSNRLWRVMKDDSLIRPEFLEQDTGNLMVSHDPEAKSVLRIQEYHLGTHTWREHKRFGAFLDLFLDVPNIMCELAEDGWGNTDSRWVHYRGAAWRTYKDQWVIKPTDKEQCAWGYGNDHITWNRKQAPVLIASLEEV